MLRKGEKSLYRRHHYVPSKNFLLCYTVRLWGMSHVRSTIMFQNLQLGVITDPTDYVWELTLVLSTFLLALALHIGCFSKSVPRLVLAPAVSVLSFSGLSDPVGAVIPEKLQGFDTWEVKGLQQVRLCRKQPRRSVRGRRNPLCGRVIRLWFLPQPCFLWSAVEGFLKAQVSCPVFYHSCHSHHETFLWPQRSMLTYR